MATLALLAKAVLVFVTLVCLASMGGAMLFAGWVLVPLHWLARRGSGPVATGGWALLAGLSVFEMITMLTWVATEHGVAAVAAGTIASAVTIVGFLLQAANGAANRPRLAG